MTTTNQPSNQAPTTTPAPPAASDVLQSDHHSHFTTEEIAKAVARHKREHPNQTNPRPLKTKPRS